ncbi:hypothetical protein A2803_03400 [Candidatus Woesebacteria bacterium RIFCSPHIGHO2_01_FULL_44_21]|uniref:Uncharacterized protein n=1 Tax=Candidatus Woesebacteria bacterium RIFCSPHIGHO2_01_FULL_44_21 TaxID=1802503 RepID=A0A1F7Z0K3_9BACT|nr:MAG: hypothetical protein A2803_03400 [Candidatus Woesebacteria bacterium RIFCSPHIGHO2_01_FULL_44_21]OGM69122.1 MAG: hypothetical protein A2897_04840 [Candidatus Woesebacteria bacterium RIFCSPLOWO2_01_FULL_44_24b]
MINKSSVRDRNKEFFKACIELRKQGLSYSEIRAQVPVAKSTLQNWLTLAGLTLTKEHLEIQLRKRVESRSAATEASRLTRAQNTEDEINKMIQETRKFFGDPLFITGTILYEAEGSKSGQCKFSNSDSRLIKTFLLFLEKFFKVDKTKNIGFSLFVHITRKYDLNRIKSFWAQELLVPVENVKVYWKKNEVVNRRKNLDYVGQMLVSVRGIRTFSRKLLAISDIILRPYYRS